MSKERAYYKDIKIIKFCKVCGVRYRPARYSHQASLGLCHTHRRIYKLEEFRKWFKKLSPEVQKKYRDREYEIWKKWVLKHMDRRRKMALESYHRRKGEPKNRARKHRATKIKD